MATAVSKERLSIQTMQEKCDDNSWHYYYFTGYCYKILSTCQSWDSAKIACNSLYSELASIHSEKENLFVGSLIPFNFSSGSVFDRQNNYASIGMFTEVNYPPKWQWTDKSAFDFSIYDGYKRDRYNCGVIINGPYFNNPVGAWSKAICDYPSGYAVCKKSSF
uniref:C-type lectin domain-containing protein n=1 Tax=Panagrolaimus davidi TaxID=227884 RepID=A0A914PFB5_9BILA